jgi:hypothetical protein
MSVAETIIWSMALGAIAAVALARATDMAVRPSLGKLQGIAYHLTVLTFVAALSGVAGIALAARDGAHLRVLQVLSGPLCVGLSNFWIRNWLNAKQRDRLMALALRASALATPLAGAACLALPDPQQLPAAAVVSLLSGALTLWLTVRAWLMGDRLAPVMAAGCALTLPAIAGLYATALALPDATPAVQAAAALCAAVSNGLTGYVLWRRDRHQWRSSHADGTAHFDPVTRLDGGSTLVRKLVRAQERRRRMRRDGALVAVMVFGIDKVVAQAGNVGANEMYMTLAGRIQRQVGVVNPVGRYYDRCFVALIETIHSPAWLRTLGLRVASSARRPIVVATADGGQAEVWPDVGVGVLHLTRRDEDVEDLLDEAEQLAEAARAMRSRAATLDPASGRRVPVEQADLGAVRPRRRAQQRMPQATARRALRA